jgi:hypothetical protein
MYSAFNCHNLARHAKFIPEIANMASTGNAGCFKKSFTILMCYENVYA